MTSNMIILWVTIATLLLCTDADDVTAPIVKLSSKSSFRGVVEHSSEGRPYSAFYRIPYAKPPVGQLRLKAPQTLNPYKGVWDSTTPPIKCIQYNYYPKAGLPDAVNGQEDCLYLNIYTPKTNGSLDVMVFIHGGAWTHGSSMAHGPAFFLNRDIIFVTIAYRLGPLGFLSTEDNVIPGNFGLKDQSMALKWIKKNIKNFGGNPKSITVAGQSCGGASVEYHMLGKLSRGLFAKAISQSGSALNPWAFQEGSRIKANKLAANLGCDTKSTRKMLKCLQGKTAAEIVNELGNFIVFAYNPFSPFGPVKEASNAGSFLTENPYDVIRRGGAQDLPWMTGMTTEEGLYGGMPVIESAANLSLVDKDYLELFPFLLDYNFTVESQNRDSVSKAVRSTYLQDAPISSDMMIKIMSDRLFNVGILDSAQLHAITNKRSGVYLYIFGYAGNHSYTDSYNTGKKYGVSHLDDTQYVTKHNLYDWPAPGSNDEQMTKVWTDIWVNFAATGKPMSTILPLDWKPVDGNSKNLAFLNVTCPNALTPSEGQGLMEDARQFWNAIPLMENEHLSSQPNVGTKTWSQKIRGIFKTK